MSTLARRDEFSFFVRMVMPPANPGAEGIGVACYFAGAPNENSQPSFSYSDLPSHTCSSA